MTRAAGRRWCDYHREWELAPICEHGKMKRLLGYDNGPEAWGHIWVCAHGKIELARTGETE